MDDRGTPYIAIAITVAVVACVNVLAIRRNRRLLREHPERIPYGKQLALRLSPFIVLLLVTGAWAAATDRIGLLVLSVVGVVAFAIDLYRRRQPPTA